MTEQKTDKAAPRPWDVFQLDEDNWGVCEEGEPPHGIFGEKQDADLTVSAVNAYDPAREEKIKALVEAIKDIIPPRSNGWWCSQCLEKKAPKQVTFEELCVDCGSVVSTNSPFDSWQPVRTALEAMENDE